MQAWLIKSCGVFGIAMIVAGGLLAWLGLSLLGSQVRVAELVQSGCDLGLQPHPGGCYIACDQPSEPTLSRIARGLTAVVRSP
jgi:hypothetical protein